MSSRQDELRSQQFAVERLVGALIAHDADPRRPPLRRSGAAVLAGVLIAALAAGVLAGYGMLTGAGRAEPTDPSVVLLDRRSGARYVYLETDRRLHPVLNYTSGLLLATGESPRVAAVTAGKLAGVPLGAPLGIPDAPDWLPPADSLLGGAWTVCTDAATGAPRGTLLVGTTPDAPVTDRALLVRDPADRTFLVHDGRRFQLPAGRTDPTMRALGWYGRTPWPVAAAWIDAVPAGPDLIAPVVPGAGSPSAAPGHRVGEVLTDSGAQFAVVMADGIAAVTEMQARLLGPASPVGAEFLRLPPAGRGPGFAAGLPPAVPRIADSPVRACVTRPADGPASVRLDPVYPSGSAPAADSRADAVHVARGRGAVVTSPGGAVQVVTDAGWAYPLASRDLLGKLGYPDVRPVPVPAELIALLPAGPLLDPRRAGR
ncbi:type VII secretion protein EccB [Actinoplanes teichomyceticus]|uniref:Type VII secretion protein EccB n=1 Tax=Actinoplanes teichomyceticus TaxID=1867 RepID=A0A561WR56_ACTTI|nr:type VII secretion protein EccB [Actinoplanes teichomyceticus]TWG26343.1 type VII secretion protein EccB [Actinoplanes teichomyceticus]GIF11421.1 type VII secretion protein EccB [Actinoplanes teichomyceticus]